MMDGIVLSVIIVVMFVVLRYIVKEKKRGKRCIGCPSGGECAKCSHCVNSEESAHKTAVPNT